MWNPTVGDFVVVNPGSDSETGGQVVEDFGEFTAHEVVIDADRVAEPARRFAVLTADALVFADAANLSAAAESPETLPTAGPVDED